MPAPDSQGRPTIRALDSDEATAWLRLLLGQGEEEAKVSFKSLKATLISWAAKRGVEPLTLQRSGYQIIMRPEVWTSCIAVTRRHHW